MSKAEAALSEPGLSCPLSKDIRKLAASFGSCEWFWVPRSQNMAALEAAKLGRGLVEAQC
ncbi:unnamed protein product [Prunus armeniaca]|uniref:RNase H type-1 domain-containing protein n=1 Tax=Prunus armeniaca TaxID=36596 RepID=A0A6J5WZS8_PRUAR|nr:unnamed protein product [Prunus armeniaca]